MTVRSRLIASGTVAPQTTTTVYTVPTDRTLVIRSVVISTVSANISGARVATTSVSSGVWQWVPAMVHPFSYWMDHWIALNPGLDVRVRNDQAAGGGNISYHIFGALLMGEPE